MTKEQVIKGLECCKIESVDCPDACPYDGMEGDICGRCFQLLAADALALLKEQEAPKTTLRQHGGTIEIITEPAVKHGRWEVWSRPGDEETGNCSVCKTTYSTEELFMGGTEFPKYCPECGARMDEEE